MSTAVRISAGFGTGLSVGATGAVAYLSTNGARRVTLINSGATAMYVGVNGIITGAPVDNASSAPQDVAIYSMTAAEAVANGFLLAAGAQVIYEGYQETTGQMFIRNVWAITDSGTSTLAGGETAWG